MDFTGMLILSRDFAFRSRAEDLLCISELTLQS